MIIPHKYKIYLDSRKTHSLLRFRVMWSSCKCLADFYIPNAKVDKAKWSPDAMRCKNNTFHFGVSAAEINKLIAHYEQCADTVFAEYERKEIIPTLEQVKEGMQMALGMIQKTERRFADIYNDFTDELVITRSIEDTTLKRANAVKNLILEWRPDIDLNELDTEAMQSFLEWQIKQQYLNPTIQKNIDGLRWFLRWARKNGLYTADALDNFTVKLKGTDGKNREIIYLTWEELIYLYHLEIRNKTLDAVRDVFCFCCFTSLRYSDVAQLQKTDTYDTYIKVVTEKTDKGLIIELNKYSRAILNKYRRIPIPRNLALPVMSNQKMNLYIKELCALVGFNTHIKKVDYSGNNRIETLCEKWELMTTHCGRRTFIVNALYLGIPAEVVMKWTGHADYDAMRPYIAIVDELKQTSMEKFNRD